MLTVIFCNLFWLFLLGCAVLLFWFQSFVSSLGKPLGILQFIAVKFFCCFIQLHVLYGFINRRCLYPPRLIRFTWRGSWQWNQTRVILKTIIQSFKCHHKSGDWWGRMMEQLLYPALGTLFWVLFYDFFFIFEKSLFFRGEYPCGCKLSRLTLNVWLFTRIRYTILTLIINSLKTNIKWSGDSQRNYYNIWKANISGKKVKIWSILQLNCKNVFQQKFSKMSPGIRLYKLILFCAT